MALVIAPTLKIGKSVKMKEIPSFLQQIYISLNLFDDKKNMV